MKPKLGTSARTWVESGDRANGLALIARDGDNDRTYHAAYSELIAPLVKAVQEQQAVIERLETLIEKQQQQIEALEAHVK